jgi:hypothetical protein
MQVELLGLNNKLAKGPLVECFSDGKTIVLNQGEPKHIDDKYGWKLLEKYPDLIRKLKRLPTRPAAPEKSVKGITKNKMVTKYRDKVDAIKRECASS